MASVARLVASVGALALAAAGLTAVPAAAAPTGDTVKVTYKICANKKTGQARLIRAGRTCRPSEVKLAYRVVGPPGMAGPTGATGLAGPTGATGPAGPQLSVRDANGQVLGEFVGYFNFGSNPWINVRFGGGIYGYATWSATGGDLRLGSGPSPVYLTDTCTAPAFSLLGDGVSAPPAGGPARVTQAFTSGGFHAFAYTGAIQTVSGSPLDFWSLDETGACTAAGVALPIGYVIAALTPVTAPPATSAAPLTVS